MNPIYAGAVAARKKLERRCKACGHVQTVPAKQLQATVKCAKCGKPLPPKPA
jgi:ribosomal protein S27E